MFSDIGITIFFIILWHAGEKIKNKLIFGTQSEKNLPPLI